MHLRVNADDLGLTARINDESFDLISRGLVDSASIIANAPETGDAILRVRQFSQCRFEVHGRLGVSAASADHSPRTRARLRWEFHKCALACSERPLFASRVMRPD
jgi:predicted glycoside hydrolase/deacetylase ChbG (UPF0249 family)